MAPYLQHIAEVRMSNPTVAKRISPMLAVADMDETLSFYREVLSFTSVMKSPGYAIVERDGQTIHFQKADSEEVMNCVRGHTEIYIEEIGRGRVGKECRS